MVELSTAVKGATLTLLLTLLRTMVELSTAVKGSSTRLPGLGLGLGFGLGFGFGLGLRVTG